MFNCLARICPRGRANIPAPAVIELVAQPATAPVRTPSPTGAPATSASTEPTQPQAQPARPSSPSTAVPVLSASAQARWRQVCNQPLKSQLDERDLLMPGARLDFTFEERAEIAGALRHLPPGVDFWSTVATACTLGNPVKFGAVETLIRHGLIDPNQTATGNTLLEIVCLYGENAWPRLKDPLTLKQRLSSLIALGAKIGREELPNITLLQQTWERDDADSHLAAAALITHGCNPLQRDEHDYNRLQRAAAEGNLPVLRGWQQAGLPMFLRTNDRLHNALHLAALGGHQEALRFLIAESDVDINERAWQGQTALFYAVDNLHVEAARTLLEKQADPHLATNTGRTPLMMAVAKRSEPLRILLLEHGADPHATDPRNWEFQSAADLYQHLHGQPWPDQN